MVMVMPFTDGLHLLLDLVHELFHARHIALDFLSTSSSRV